VFSKGISNTLLGPVPLRQLLVAVGRTKNEAAAVHDEAKAATFSCLELFLQ
jgi:hypothetical protein